MSSLMLPEHMARQEAARKVALEKRQMAAAAAFAAEQTSNALMSDDFASPDDVRDQLQKLTDYIAARRKDQPDYHLPKASGWRLTVLMLTIPERTKGGLQVIDEARDQRSLSSPQGIVIDVGSGCYTDPARFEVDGVLTPWHVVGDRIIFVKYDAQVFQLPNGQRLGFLTDTQPIALLDRGWEAPK